MLLGFALLVIGGEFLVRSSVALSFRLNISKMAIGLTVVSFATSVPELLVSLNAAFNGSPDIAINNVIGSNIANIGLVLGLTALLGAIGVDRVFYKVNWPVMMIFSLGLYYFLKNDQWLTTIEGLILFLALVLFVCYLLLNSKSSNDEDKSLDALLVVSNFKIITWLIIGAFSLYKGSDWLVEGAKGIANSMGLSEAVISVSMIAVGTSIPELAASIIAIIKKEKAISLGNLIGSNIFNIGSVLGLTALIKPISISDPGILSRDILWMLVFAVLMLPLVLIRKPNQLRKTEGFILVATYTVFMVIVFS